MPSPLDKVRVLDFSHLLPGELCSTILSDLGCQVIRIESLKPGLGKLLPPLIKGESLYYWSLHRNKRRICLDLKSEKGVEVVKRLVKESDVVLENFRPGVMNRLGIGYRPLRRVNKSLIFCSISGYGQNSAWSHRPGHDLNYVAEAGILSLNRRPDGPPVLPGVLVSDYMAAIYGALAVAAALFEREHTGKGKHLDISMFECALSSLNILATMLLYTGQPESGFTYRADLPNYNIYECRDGKFLAVASLEPQFWATFCERIGRPDLKTARPTGPDTSLQAEIANILKARTQAEWLQVFEQGDCCVSPVHTLEEALSHLPARERGVITHIIHPILGKVPQMASPVAMKSADHKVEGLAGDPARETARLLKKLGYTRNEIAELSSERVIPALAGR
jgi:crotonobetainyl-CoA:carnitine CoA-transferase CaiB-like acyl-CoA transferase